MKPEDKIYDLTFYAEKLEKIAKKVEDPITRSELFFISEKMLELKKGDMNAETKAALRNLLVGHG